MRGIRRCHCGDSLLRSMLRPTHHRIFRNTIPLNNTVVPTALVEKASKASDRPLLEAARQN
jgi:hypothetical protein